MTQSEPELALLTKAEEEAPRTADPASGGATERALQREIRLLTAFLGVWTLFFLGSIPGWRDPGILIGAPVIYAFGLYMLLPALRTARGGMQGAFARQAVVILDRRQQGRFHDEFVAVIADRTGARRELRMVTPALADVGEVGVAISRGAHLWAFHPVTAEGIRTRAEPVVAT